VRSVCEFCRKALAPESNAGRWQRAFVLLSAAFGLLLLPAPAPAQRIPKQELQFLTQPYTPITAASVRRNVFLVEINAVVRDAEGHAVAGLRRGDFHVYDNGKEQTLTQFKALRAAPGIVGRQSASPTRALKIGASPPSKAAATKPAPRYVALFFDDRMTSFGDLKYAQKAAEKFVRKDISPGDRVGVFTASRSVTLNFTDERQQLLGAIASLSPKPVGTVPPTLNPCTRYPLNAYTSYLILDRADREVLSLYTCRSNNPNVGRVNVQRIPMEPPSQADLENQARNILHSTEIVVLDSLESLESTIAQLGQMPGRRVVVLISSGFFTASMKRSLDEVAADALHANVVVDTLDAKGLVAPEAGKNENAPFSGAASPLEQMLYKHQQVEKNDVMSALAMDTGGTFFHNNNDLAGGLQQMAAVPEVSYLLGFAPSHLKHDGRYHGLKVKVARSGSFHIQAREGYFAPTKASRRKKNAKKREDRLDPEVLKTDDMAQLPVKIAAQAGRLPSGKTGMLISLRMDPRTLEFQKHKGRHLDQLSLVVALFNGAGKFVIGERGFVNMALKQNSLEGLIRRGLNARVVLQAPEGKYRLRVVVEELGTGKMFATTRPANIP
jgi:VWFA-related protein